MVIKLDAIGKYRLINYPEEHKSSSCNSHTLPHLNRSYLRAIRK
jgi:hypothetical protein